MARTPLMFAFIIFNIGDLILTKFLVGDLGLPELNPIADCLFQSYGFYGLCFIKVVPVLISLFCIVKIYMLKRPEVGKRLLVSFSALYGSVCLYQLLGLLAIVL